MATPSQELIDACLALAYGRLDPEAWLAWWDNHEVEVEKSLSRGWFLRLKPRGRHGASINGILFDSQCGACYLLDQLKIPYDRSNRYEVASEQEMAAFHQGTKRPKSAEENRRLAELAERFRKLGAADPDGWARSEAEEDIPQLATFVFLRELWRLVIPVGDMRALNRFGRKSNASRGAPLRRLKEKGVDLADVLQIVREAQADIVRQTAFVLDQVDELGPDLEDVRWALYELDADDRPVRPMDGLHESVDDEEIKPSQE